MNAFKKFLSAVLIVTAFSEMGCSDPHQSVVKQEAGLIAMARGRIDIDGGLINIAFQHDGLVEKLLVTPGQSVKQGEPLARLKDNAVSLKITQANLEIELAKAQLASAESKLAMSEKIVKRWNEALASGVEENPQAEEAQALYRQAQFDRDAAKTALEISKTKLQEVQNFFNNLTLRAPAAGEILKINIQEGGATISTANAFVLLPQKPFMVKADVNETFANKIRVGNKATVSLENSPTLSPFSAHVRIVGKLLESPRGNDEQPQPGRTIEVQLDFEKPQTLLVGQNVMVKFYE